MKYKLFIVLNAFALLVFSGCSNFQLKPTTAKHVPKYLSLGNHNYTVCQLSNVSGIIASDQYYSTFIQQLLQNRNNNQVIIVPQQVYHNLLRAKAAKLFDFQEMFSKPASELSVSEQNEIRLLYPQFFTSNFFDTQCYLKSQTYYFLNELNETSLFDEGHYYTELDKERYVVQLQKQYHRDLNKIVASDWIIIPCIDATSPSFKKTLSEDSPIMISGSGSDTIARDLLDPHSALSKSITPKFVILSNTLYTGYVVRNHAMIFLVGGSKLHYQYSGYNITLQPQLCSIENFSSLHEDNNLLEILGN